MPHPRPEERRRRVWRDAGSDSCFAAPFFGPRVADATNGAKSPRMVISLPPATHFTSLILRRLLRSKRPRKDTPEDAVCLFASASLWPSRRQSHKPLEIGSHGDFLTAGAAFHRPHPEAPLAKQEASKDAPKGAVCLFASASLWPSRRQFHKPLEIGSHIGLLLGARPAFDSPLSRDSFVDAFIVFGEDQLHRPARRRVTGDQSLRMLAHSLLNRTPRDPSVIAAVGAQEDIDRCAAQVFQPLGTALPDVTTLCLSPIALQHGWRLLKRPSRPLASQEAPQDEGRCCARIH